MGADQRVTFRWHGAAHYQISYQDLKILIDPLYTRSPGDKPHLDVSRADVERVDHILLTHGHLDHSRDVPYLAAEHDPEVHAPGRYLRDLRKWAERSGSERAGQRYHDLEEIKGKTFSIADIDVTPFQIGTEQIDFWFVRSLFLRPLIHATPSGILGGIMWLTHHLFGNCFAFQFRFPPDGRTMLYFGNLTDQTEELSEIDRVDVLALPYCPANRKWMSHSQCLIERFRPSVILVHHFDNFAHPFTLSKYMNLDEYRKALRERCPDARFVFSKFLRDVDLAEIMDS
jgi:L-ascorbate metabolism protein UlaG (beta-lactamase superfamily)